MCIWRVPKYPGSQHMLRTVPRCLHNWGLTLVKSLIVMCVDCRLGQSLTPTDLGTLYASGPSGTVSP